jgi:hypothetical protein
VVIRVLAATELAVLMVAPLGIVPLLAARPSGFGTRAASTPVDLRRLANSYYDSVKVRYPVSSSGQGLHPDDRLTDYRPAAIEGRRACGVFCSVRAIAPRGSRDDQIDWVLFCS